ncbi:MAG: hypothetical protein LBT80_00365 [Lactobacillaceae bacterium]|jgi:hypothetical protein|nr:hypothetical protein [Lactobacillaceae bacterium]
MKKTTFISGLVLAIISFVVFAPIIASADITTSGAQADDGWTFDGKDDLNGAISFGWTFDGQNKAVVITPLGWTFD